jgi:hypothetical protein
VTEPVPPAIPPPPPPAASVAAVINLEPQLAATPSAQLLAEIPWDGPPLDPDVLEARAMLTWLR